MDEKERTESFLSAFKRLEKGMVSLSDLGGDYVSFSRALNYVYDHRLSPLVSRSENYDFFKTASDVRNILAHEENPIVPTDAFLKRFLALTEAFLNPLSCYQAATKAIVSVSLKTPIPTAIARMEKEGLSHLPILDADGVVLGVFSRSAFFDAMAEQGKIEVDEEARVIDFLSVSGLESHHNESFPFVPRDLSVRKAYEGMMRRKPHEKNVALLLVTEHGKSKERLLGVLTASDLARVNELAE